jgi:hypothetical protein
VKDTPITKPQLNITIFWDLSDRISPAINPSKPEHFEKDTAIIKTFAEIFAKEMNTKGTFLSKGRLKLTFNPLPEDAEINELAKNLNIDLEPMDNNQKKVVFDNIIKSFPENAMKIYTKTIENKNNNWDGSDIWRFFKNDVKDYCISKKEDYRNILVIITDGYIYHKNSKFNDGNKYSFILPELLNKFHLRNNQKWEQIIEKEGFGLLSSRNDLQDLEILVLEITPLMDSQNDEDVVKKVLSNWFTEMNAKRFAIYNTDLPINTKQRILDFIENK